MERDLGDTAAQRNLSVIPFPTVRGFRFTLCSLWSLW